jgi:nucleotide-binding universal stress UspA family protein
MIKDIVANLAIGSERDIAGEFALSIAETFQAHVAGIAFWFEPVLPGEVVVEGGVPPEIMEALRERTKTSTHRAVERFDERAKRAGIRAETRTLRASHPAAPDLFAHAARRFDLSVLKQAERESSDPDDDIAEAALFDSGRPVVMVPYIQKTGLKLDRVMICWDGSRAAARAIGDALPFLMRATNVDVVIATQDPGRTDELAGAEIGRHLAHHDVKVEVHRIPAVDIDIGNALLSYAADLTADFMVMGGYGHSRLREFILGGVTRTVMESMTLPTLMTH